MKSLEGSTRRPQFCFPRQRAAAGHRAKGHCRGCLSAASAAATARGGSFDATSSRSRLGGAYVDSTVHALVIFSWHGRHPGRTWSPTAVAIGCSAIALLAFASPTVGAVPSCASPASRAYRHYDLGARFGSLKALPTIRRCEPPYPGERIRANFFERQYARCNGCEATVSIQSWPACERSRADVTEPRPGGLPLPEMRRLRLRRVPGLYFVEDRRLKLYTGRTTVVLFGPNLSTLRRAAFKLRTSRGAREVVP